MPRDRDSLGASVEFQVPGEFEPVRGMLRYITHNLPSGSWTDDTSMALCLADSLVQEQHYDSFDDVNRYQRWASEGDRSSTCECFTMGTQVNRAFTAYEEGPWVLADA